MADTDIATPRYGKKKLDPEALAAQLEATTREGRESTRFGARKIETVKSTPVKGDSRTRTTTDPKVEERAPTGTVPAIPALKKLLRETPAQLDAAIEVEMKQEKPRKGALQLFLEIEEGKGEDARPDVVAKIGAALSAFEE